MADQEKLYHIAGCLTEVYALFANQYVAQKTAQAAAVFEAVNDPLQTLMDKNVNALVGDMVALAQGDPMANMARAGLGLLWQEKGKEFLNESLNFIFGGEDTQGRKDLNSAVDYMSRALSLVHLLISVTAEAPYAIAQLALRSAQPFIDQKRCNLNCLRTHVIQLNNALLAAGVDPLKVNSEIEAAIAEFLVELQAAKEDVGAVYRALKGAGGFMTKRFQSVQEHLRRADAVMSPEWPGSSIFDVVVAFTKTTIPSDFMTTSNRRLALFTAKALAALIEVDFQAIRANTLAINLIIGAITAITADLAKVNQSAKVRDLRLRLLTRFNSELDNLINQVNHSTGATTSTIGKSALAWVTEVRSLRVQADKIATADLTQSGATGSSIDALKAALMTVQAELAVDLPPDIENGLEDTTSLQQKVRTLTGTATKMMRSIEATKDPAQVTSQQGAIDFQLASLPPLVKATLARIEESRVALEYISSAVDDYVAIDIPFTNDLADVIELLGGLGMDRAQDLLRTGKVSDLMNINNVQLASYSGIALECLLQSAADAPDRGTAQLLSGFAEQVKTTYFNKLVTASNYLSGSGIDFVNDIRFQIDEVQRMTAIVTDVLKRLQELGVDIQEAGKQMKENVAGIDAAHAAASITACGSLYSTRRKVTTAGTAPPTGPLCQII